MNYKDTFEFNKLNAFEKILLLAVLVELKDPDAEKIKSWIEVSAKRNEQSRQT